MRLKVDWKRLGMLLLGSTILSFGLFNVHSQSQITEGGVLGTTLLVRHWLHISPAITEVVLDALCYSLGVRFLGRDFLKRAIAATGGFAVTYAIFEKIGYVLPNMIHQPLLASVVGGLFVGVGAGLVVRAGGASGGDDALALVIAKLAKCNVSRAYLLTDVTVLLLSLSYIPVQKIAWSLLSVTISSALIGPIQSWKGKRRAEA